jgi:thioredoxin-related protein
MIHKIVLSTLLLAFSTALGVNFYSTPEAPPAAQTTATASQEGATSKAHDIRWYSMREAQLKATTSGKKVLVHIYAQWCVWCKKMDKETYSEVPVRQEISKYYFPVRINGESDAEMVFNGQIMTMKEFTKSLGITAYPTTLFIDQEGSIITQQGGFIKPNIFVKLLAYVGSDAYELQEFDQFTSNHEPRRRD